MRACRSVAADFVLDGESAAGGELDRDGLGRASMIDFSVLSFFDGLEHDVNEVRLRVLLVDLAERISSSLTGTSLGASVMDLVVPFAIDLCNSPLFSRCTASPDCVTEARVDARAIALDGSDLNTQDMW